MGWDTKGGESYKEPGLQRSDQGNWETWSKRDGSCNSGLPSHRMRQVHHAAACCAACVFPLQESNVHDTCGHYSSVSFYWPNQQYCVPGHNVHSAEPPLPVLPSTENAQVKKHQIQARHANANFLCANQSTCMPCSKSCCLHWNVWYARFGAENFDWKSTHRFSDYLGKLFASSHFKAVRTGKLGTLILCKGSSTYASQFDLLRDWISLCGRWRSNKKQVDTYIDVDVPYPNAKVASILCCTWGLCKYTTRDGVELTDDFLCLITPWCVKAFGREVAVVLAHLLLWAAFEDDVRVNEQVIFLIPSEQSGLHGLAMEKGATSIL